MLLFPKVYDGAIEESSKIGESFCGNETLPLFTASSNVLIVKFVSDDSDSRTGFKALFTAEIQSKKIFLEILHA